MAVPIILSWKVKKSKIENMLKYSELKEIAQARIKDSEILLDNKRYDGAIYLCGYAIEIALKARICKILKWPKFPSTQKDFQNYTTFKTHNLDVLLSLSGVEAKIKKSYFADWSNIAQWDPEIRYKPIGSATKIETESMLASTKKLLEVLL